MDSGIYQLTYSTGQTYVGKSIHLHIRWKQHFDKLLKGKAAKNMQDAYEASDHCYPKTQVLLYCHPDMLDYYEGYFINYLKPDLNTSIPEELSEYSKGVLVNHANQGFAKYSVVAAIQVMNDQVVKIRELEEGAALQVQEFESLESDYHELSEAWNKRAVRDNWANRDYRQMVETCEELGEDALVLRAEVGSLKAWQLRVEQAGWWQRLWRTW
jgi:hypothetical protein